MAYLWFYFVATLIRVDAARALLSTSFGGSRRRVFTALPVRVSAECFFNARDQIGGQRARRRPRRRALLWATSRVFLRKTRYSASRRLHPSPSLNTSINTWPRAVTETRGGQYTAIHCCSTCSAPREVQRSNPEASRVVSGSERNEKKTKRGASAPSPSSLAPARGQW